MASINGIALRNTKFFNGDDGIPLMQGSVYQNGTKIGTWSDDYNGGAINFVPWKIEGAIKPAIIRWLVGSPWLPQDLYKKQEVLINAFISDCLFLNECEKVFKKCRKEKYAGIIVAAPYTSYGVTMDEYSINTLSVADSASWQAHLQRLRGQVQQKSGAAYVHGFYFRKLEDFDIQRGKESDAARLRAIITSEEQARRAKFDAERQKAAEAEAALEARNAGRFVTYDEGMDVVVEDTKTKRKAKVSRMSGVEVRKALIELFC